MTHQSTLHILRTTLEASREGRMSVEAMCQTWRAQAELLSALPPRYGQVMEDLLGRMEAGSLFGEESCSFSPEDLLTSLSVWLDKATRALEG